MKILTASIFESLQIFKCLSQTGNFTECGRILSIPKSKVSRSIQSLEDRMGFRLFYRTTRQVQLTPEGKALITKIEPLLSDFENVIEMQEHALAKHFGELSITAPEDIGILLLPKFSTEFSRIYPNIKMEIILTNQTIDLIKENVDLALRVGRIKDSSHLYAKRIAKIKMIKVQSFRGSTQKIASIDDLKSLPYLDFGKMQKRKKISMTTKKDVSSKIEIETYMASNSFFVIKEFLRAQTSWAILPQFLIENELMTGEFVEILPDWQIPQEDLYLLNLSGKHKSVRVRLFFEFLVKKFQGLDL